MLELDGDSGPAETNALWEETETGLCLCAVLL